MRAQRLRKSSHGVVPPNIRKSKGWTTRINLTQSPVPSSTETAYLCVYIRMNGSAVVLLACLSFPSPVLSPSPLHVSLNPPPPFSSSSTTVDACPTGISSRNIFGWRPLMSARHPKKIRLVGDSSVVQLCIYFFFLLFFSQRHYSLALFLPLFFLSLFQSLSYPFLSVVSPLFSPSSLLFPCSLAHMINVCQEYHPPLRSTTSRGALWRSRSNSRGASRVDKV